MYNIKGFRAAGLFLLVFSAPVWGEGSGSGQGEAWHGVSAGAALCRENKKEASPVRFSAVDAAYSGALFPDGGPWGGFWRGSFLFLQAGKVSFRGGEEAAAVSSLDVSMGQAAAGGFLFRLPLGSRVHGYAGLGLHFLSLWVRDREEGPYVSNNLVYDQRVLTYSALRFGYVLDAGFRIALTDVLGLQAGSLGFWDPWSWSLTAVNDDSDGGWERSFSLIGAAPYLGVSLKF